jgi:hypothetical protein
MTKRRHKGCEHGQGGAWTLAPTRRWFKRCDSCGQFRLWADYFEVYDAGVCWWWECERCLLATITAWGEKEANR